MSEEKKSKKMKKSSLIAICAIAVIAVAVIVIAVSGNGSAKDYKNAAAMMENGQYAEAAFTALGEYEDSTEMAVNCRKAAKEANYLTGFERIELGSYEQDNDSSNGREAIEWSVLAEEDGKMLITSLCALDASAFRNTLEVKIAWSSSSMREWLNDSFLNEAFTVEEQERILDTELVNNGRSDAKGASDENTIDKIFLLSADELEKYFADEASRKLIASEYAEVNCAIVSKNNGNTSWWLRAPREIGNISLW